MCEREKEESEEERETEIERTNFIRQHYTSRQKRLTVCLCECEKKRELKTNFAS